MFASITLIVKLVFDPIPKKPIQNQILGKPKNLNPKTGKRIYCPV